MAIIPSRLPISKQFWYPRLFRNLSEPDLRNATLGQILITANVGKIQTFRKLDSVCLVTLCMSLARKQSHWYKACLDLWHLIMVKASACCIVLAAVVCVLDRKAGSLHLAHLWSVPKPELRPELKH